MLDKDDILKDGIKIHKVSLTSDEASFKKTSVNKPEKAYSMTKSAKAIKRSMTDLENMKKNFPWVKKPIEEYWYNTDLINETADKALCKLWMVVGVCVVFIIAEVVGGVIANS